MNRNTIAMFVVMGANNPMNGGPFVSTYFQYEGLRRMGYHVRVFKIGVNTQKCVKVSKRAFKLPYQIVSIDDACKIAQYLRHPGVISQTNLPKLGVSELIRLMEVGCKIMMRTTTDFGGPVCDYLKTMGAHPIVIREQIGAELRKQYGIEALFVPHVYIPMFDDIPDVNRRLRAVSLARVTLLKGTHLIVEANHRLPPSKRIHIYGHENRRYAKYILDEQYKGWRRFYHGSFLEGTGAHIASNAEFVVDLTKFSGDGGGTQRTFFEAWDAGSVLVVDKKWTGGSVVEKKHALAVSGVDDLVHLMKHGARRDIISGDMIRYGRNKLKEHAPEVVIPMFVRAVRK